MDHCVVEIGQNVLNQKNLRKTSFRHTRPKTFLGPNSLGDFPFSLLFSNHLKIVFLSGLLKIAIFKKKRSILIDLRG